MPASVVTAGGERRWTEGRGPAQDPVERLALSADRRRLASVAHDSTLRLWDMGFLHEDADSEPGGADGDADGGAASGAAAGPSTRQGAAAAAAAAAEPPAPVRAAGCVARCGFAAAEGHERLCSRRWCRHAACSTGTNRGVCVRHAGARMSC